LRLLIIKGVRF